jgi:hypothetical protein
VENPSEKAKSETKTGDGDGDFGQQKNLTFQLIFIRVGMIAAKLMGNN